MTDTAGNTATSTPVAPMRLRAEAPRVTRLSRKMLASVAAVALVGIGGSLIYALQTRGPDDGGAELYSTNNRQTADGLAGLPKDYSGPILGPALPGDLGRPIVDAQNNGQPVVTPAVPTPGVSEAEQRRRAEEEAARLSTVFFQSRQGSTAASTAGAMPGLAGLDLSGAGGQAATGQDKQLAFLNAAADRRTVTPDRVTPPASPFVLQAGAVISAALITGIRSDLPGQIIAQVTEPIYDSPTGRILLVPQGTRIIGQYDNNVQ
ncbi:MAG: TrbI/VirB10 family protein, partial [Rhizobiaceae bacterium]